MQMPDVSIDSWPVRGGGREQILGYEHVVSVLLPWRRYNRLARPVPCEGSPSTIEVGAEDRHGALLMVSRYGSRARPTADEVAEMTGELAESWVLMTLITKSTP